RTDGPHQRGNDLRLQRMVWRVERRPSTDGDVGQSMQLMNRTKILRRRVLRLVPFAAIALAIAATIPASSLTPSAALPAPLPIADLAQKAITLTSPLETTPPITQQTAERSLHGYFGDVSVGLPVLRQVHLGFLLRGRADCTC